MHIPFVKYQGTGNDFVLIDQRQQTYIQADNVALINGICDRRFGIGADGLILLQEKTGYDFEMIYFNADGKPSSMCGNGGRCIVAFSKSLGIISDKAHFHAVDGPHDAIINGDQVELKMGDVESLVQLEDHYELDTGSPHYVTFVEDIDDIRVVENAQAIRYGEVHREKGINVNFVEEKDGELIVFTYERGVEAETLSCGTGVTAAALAYHQHSQKEFDQIAIRTKGGNLQVKFKASSQGYTDIWLCGPATSVFEGALDTEHLRLDAAPKKYFS